MAETVGLCGQNSNIVSSSTSAEFKKPSLPNKKIRKGNKVLEESSYLQEMGKIIQRDFFPHLEKLHAQNDYLEALAHNDYRRIYELQVKHSSGKMPPLDQRASPATFETPCDIRHTDNDQFPENFRLTETINSEQTKDRYEEEIVMEEKRKLTLDQYLNVHTSEDNQSFQDMIEESELRLKLKHTWMYKSEEEESSNTKLDVPSIEEQIEKRQRPLNIDTWTYKNKNYIMFVPDGIDLSDAKRIEMAHKHQEIVHSNTRLDHCPFNLHQNKESIQGAALSQARTMDGKIGVDGKELTALETPKVNGFSFVKTPIPVPGANESPFMTWGEIEGTPFNLSSGDASVRGTPGPSFKFPETPKREKLALALAEKAGERHRDRKNKAIEAARRHFISPKLCRPSSGASLQRLANMSPAAQRLASSHITKRIGSDRALLASYSPARHNTLTPSCHAAKTPLSHASTTPKTTSLWQTTTANITDNLLKLNLPKRPRASDFF